MSLRFLGKVAFIANIFFVASLVLRYRMYSTQQDVNSHIVLLGWLVAPLANSIFAIGWAISKKENAQVPKLLGLANIVFLLVQISLFFILR
ncbi:MAG: hypothetical protein QM610_05470 [Chitinophagaceae bacterium]